MSTPVTGGTIPLDGFYDRILDGSQDGKNYDRPMFVAGRIFQSAEANEIVSASQARLKSIADSLFKDGDISRDARCILDDDPNNPTMAKVTLESGAIYLAGAMRGVGPGSFSISKTGTVVIGVWMIQKIITSADDPSLLDPAAGTRGYNEPGAERLQIIPTWGWQGDGTTGAEFFPIYYVDDGQLRAKEPPPNLDAVTQAIAKYDVDSNGSNYVVSGMRVSRMDDDPGSQKYVFNIDAGRARVNGFAIALPAARRLLQAFTPDLKVIDSEAHNAKGGGTESVDVFRPPINRITKVVITRQTDEELTRGQQAGGIDNLGQPTAKAISKVYVPAGPGGTPAEVVYIKGTDWQYAKTSTGQDITDQIDWSLSGTGSKEPAVGQKYHAIYTYTDGLAMADSFTDTAFQITGAVAGTDILVSYESKLPRIDRLVIDETGKFSWINGVASDFNPIYPQVPSNVLALAQVYHTWYSGPQGSGHNQDYVISDAVRMVSMSDLEGMNQRMDTMTDLIAQLNLLTDVNTRESAAKKGVFVDPMTGEDNRDPSFTQTAAIASGALQLPIAGPAVTDVSTPSADITSQLSCDFVYETVLSNTARTGEMKVNPYMAFAPFPAQVTLNPSIDRWVRTETNWLSAETRYFTTVVYAPWSFQLGIHGTTQVTGSTETTELVSTTTRDDEYLREIDVAFVLTGFAPNEPLDSVFFDSISVNPTP